MRIDHYAYQQATRVAVFGFLIQLAIGLTALLFGRLGNDTTFVYASYSVLTGCIVWVSLIVIFQQHKLERLEALEADELAALRGTGTSVFDREGDDLKVAARRLKLMHKWLMPIVSLVTAGLLALLAILIWRDFSNAGDVTSDAQAFSITSVPGWAVAICLFLAAIAFIFSRFVAGMAKQQAWQNLRGGAGYMVGNALVLFAVAVGVIFVFFDKRWVMETVSKGISIYMLVLAFEILLNFMLNLYRPRRPGEMPRPAFDSRVLSLFAAPDSIVRSINEAVNYQFGFDITSSWGYQLLLRSFMWLAAFAIVVLVAMNMIVVVEPGEQALRLRGGRIVDSEPHGPGMMFKLPWPIESAHIEKVSRIREMALGAKSRQLKPLNLWEDELNTDVEMKPFIVGAGSSGRAGDGADTDDPTDLSLVNAELIMYWRIRPDGLVKFLTFADTTESKRQFLNMRDRTIRAIALREASLFLKDQPFDEVISQGTQSLGPALRERIQVAFDAMNTGIEVVTVTVPLLKPPKDIIPAFSELSIEREGRREKVIAASQHADLNLITEAASTDMAMQVVARIDQYRDLQKNKAEPGEITAKMLEIEQMILKANGRSAANLARAQADRWKLNMSALTRSREVLGDLASFLVAPELYKQRKIMDVLSGAMSRVRAKYVFGVDPSKVNIDFTVQEPDSGLNISENVSDKSQSNGEEANP